MNKQAGHSPNQPRPPNGTGWLNRHCQVSGWATKTTQTKTYRSGLGWVAPRSGAAT